MLDLNALDNLPDIDILEEEGITLQGMLDEMVGDFEAYFENKNDESITLYPGDDRRIELEVIAAKLYQFAEIINTNYRFNFIKWMYGDRLKNWGANFGYVGSGEEYAETILSFTLSAEQLTDVTIPAGTRATAGDNIFFATDEDLVISAGEESGSVSATCTVAGTSGNGYAVGQLNIIADPVNLVASVSNTVASAGGHDEYTDDELKLEILNFTDNYSTSGPESAYEAHVREFSPQVADAKADSDTAGVVNIYTVLLDGELPDSSMLNDMLEYLIEKAAQPDTDSIVMNAASEVPYDIEISYYIPSGLRDNEDDIKLAVDDAILAFKKDNAENIGQDVDPGQLLSYVMAAGAQKVVIAEPSYISVEKNEVGICGDVSVTYNGLS